MTRRPDVPRTPRRRDNLPQDPIRGLRCDDDTWDTLDRVAARNGVTRSFVLKVLARDYANGDLDAPDIPATGGASRSARISDDEWAGLTERASAEGTYASRVLVALAREYNAGRIQLHVSVSTSQEPLDSQRGHGT